MTGDGKVWFLTGTSSNFGIALTDVLRKAGCRVVATARTPSKLPFNSDDSLLILTLDVNDPLSISRAFDDALKHFGRIDVVVNKAGVSTLAELESMPENVARNIFGAHCWGPARVQETVGATTQILDSSDMYVRPGNNHLQNARRHGTSFQYHVCKRGFRCAIGRHNVGIKGWSASALFFLCAR